MAIQDDISVAANGDIRYTGTTENYTVIAFHRWLGDLMDDAQAAGNDLLDITSATASERATDNLVTLLAPFNIDDTLAEHLYDGSIVQAGGDVIYDGLVVIAPAGTYVDIIQNGAVLTNYWTTALNADAAQGFSHRLMVKVRAAGADIDGRRLIGQTREFGSTYSEFRIGAGTSRGNNVLALSAVNDLNNLTVAGTVAGWTTITNIEGYRLIDADGNGTNEPYYSEWTRDTFSINQFYERMKWLTRRGSAETLYGLDGALFRGVTHELDLTAPRTGTFAAQEAVTWSGGTGRMFAIDSTTVGTKMWIQLLTGVPPTNTQVITGTSTATASMSGTAIERPLSFPFAGQSTGSALIGGYGLGIEAADLTASDRLFDLGNVQRTPPNNVTFSVLGLVSTEDRVLVGPATGGLLNTAQFTLPGALTGAAVTSVLVSATIPSDTPASGTIRIELNSGIFRRVEYTSFTAATFTITSTDFSGDNAGIGNEVFISYIDKLAASGTETFSVVYASNRDVFIRVRDGGGSPIKTFETAGVVGAAGGSATVIRTPDV